MSLDIIYMIQATTLIELWETYVSGVEDKVVHCGIYVIIFSSVGWLAPR